MKQSGYKLIVLIHIISHVHVSNRVTQQPRPTRKARNLSDRAARHYVAAPTNTSMLYSPTSALYVTRLLNEPPLNGPV